MLHEFKRALDKRNNARAVDIFVSDVLAYVNAVEAPAEIIASNVHAVDVIVDYLVERDGGYSVITRYTELVGLLYDDVRQAGATIVVVELCRRVINKIEEAFRKKRFYHEKSNEYKILYILKRVLVYCDGDGGSGGGDDDGGGGGGDDFFYLHPRKKRLAPLPPRIKMSVSRNREEDEGEDVEMEEGAAAAAMEATELPAAMNDAKAYLTQGLVTIEDHGAALDRCFEVLGQVYEAANGLYGENREMAHRANAAFTQYRLRIVQEEAKVKMANREIELLKSALDDRDATIRSLQETMAHEAARLDAVQADVHNVEKSRLGTATDLQMAQAEARRLNEDKEVARRKISQLEDQIARLESDVRSLNAGIKDGAKQLEVTREENRSLEETVRDLTQKLAVAGDKSLYDSTLQNLQKELSGLQNDLDEQKRKTQVCNDKLRDMKRDRDLHEDDLREQLQALENRVAMAERAKETLEEDLKKMKHTNRDFSKKETLMRTELDDAKAKIAELQREVSFKKNELATAKIGLEEKENKLRSEVAEAADREQGLQLQLESAKNKLRTVRAELERAISEKQRLVVEADTLRSALEEAKAMTTSGRGSGSSGTVAELKKQVTMAKKELDRLRRELEDQRQEFDRLSLDNNKEISDLKRMAAQLENELKTCQRDKEEASRRFEESRDADKDELSGSVTRSRCARYGFRSCDDLLDVLEDLTRQIGGRKLATYFDPKKGGRYYEKLLAFGLDSESTLDRLKALLEGTFGSGGDLGTVIATGEGFLKSVSETRLKWRYAMRGGAAAVVSVAIVQELKAVDEIELLVKTHLSDYVPKYNESPLALARDAIRFASTLLGRYEVDENTRVLYECTSLTSFFRVDNVVARASVQFYGERMVSARLFMEALVGMKEDVRESTGLTLELGDGPTAAATSIPVARTTVAVDDWTRLARFVNAAVDRQRRFDWIEQLDAHRKKLRKAEEEREGGTKGEREVQSSVLEEYGLSFSETTREIRVGNSVRFLGSPLGKLAQEPLHALQTTLSMEYGLRVDWQTNVVTIADRVKYSAKGGFIDYVTNMSLAINIELATYGLTFEYDDDGARLNLLTDGEIPRLQATVSAYRSFLMGMEMSLMAEYGLEMRYNIDGGRDAGTSIEMVPISTGGDPSGSIVKIEKRDPVKLGREAGVPQLMANVVVAGRKYGLEFAYDQQSLQVAVRETSGGPASSEAALNLVVEKLSVEFGIDVALGGETVTFTVTRREKLETLIGMNAKLDGVLKAVNRVAAHYSLSFGFRDERTNVAVKILPTGRLASMDKLLATLAHFGMEMVLEEDDEAEEEEEVRLAVKDEKKFLTVPTVEKIRDLFRKSVGLDYSPEAGGRLAMWSAQQSAVSRKYGMTFRPDDGIEVRVDDVQKFLHSSPQFGTDLRTRLNDSLERAYGLRITESAMLEASGDRRQLANVPGVGQAMAALAKYGLTLDEGREEELAFAAGSDWRVTIEALLTMAELRDGDGGVLAREWRYAVQIHSDLKTAYGVSASDERSYASYESRLKMAMFGSFRESVETLNETLTNDRRRQVPLTDQFVRDVWHVVHVAAQGKGTLSKENLDRELDLHVKKLVHDKCDGLFAYLLGQETNESEQATIKLMYDSMTLDTCTDFLAKAVVRLQEGREGAVNRAYYRAHDELGKRKGAAGEIYDANADYWTRFREKLAAYELRKSGSSGASRQVTMASAAMADVEDERKRRREQLKKRKNNEDEVSLDSIFRGVDALSRSGRDQDTAERKIMSKLFDAAAEYKLFHEGETSRKKMAPSRKKAYAAYQSDDDEEMVSSSLAEDRDDLITSTTTEVN